MNTTRRTLVVTAIGAGLALGTMTALPGSAGAQEAWPSKPIRVIVPFKPGGRTDTVARLIAKEIEEEGLLPQPLVVVNMPGGGGAVGGQAVLDSDDGHTVAHWHHQMLIASAMDIVNFGPDDFRSIGFTGGGSPVWSVRNDSGIETLSDLVDTLQAEPESLVEVIGIGSIPHFVGELLAKEAGFKTRKVQAGSGADRLKMIAGGNADISLFAASEYLNMKDVGDGLRAVVFFGPNRIDNIADVPTAKELGYDVHDLAHVSTFYSIPGLVTEQMHCYLARYTPADKVEGDTGADADEVLDVEEWPLKALWESYQRGDLQDIKAIVCLMALRLEQPDLFA